MTTTISSHGYVRVKCPGHPDADVAGYRYEHRLVAEKMLGRRLRRLELVHHINGDKTDNRPENLEVVTLPQHKVEHRGPNSHLRQPEQPNPTIVCACGCGQTLLKFDSHGRPRDHVARHSWRKGRHGYDPEEMTTCACGCGVSFHVRDEWGRKRKYITGHNMHS